MINQTPPTSRDDRNAQETMRQQLHSSKEPRINTPSLVILLGSTPARASLELCRQMLNLPARDYRRVALVYIDTDDAPSELVAFRKQHEGVFQEFNLRIGVPPGINFATQPMDDMQTYIPAKAPQYFANGAGGIRNNGHVAAAFDHQKILQTLESALVAIERLGTSQDERHVREIQANIVAFLGGGTGGGIMQDIAVIVRQMLQKRQYQQRINLFCMLPEPIMGASDNDVSWRKSNATATLMEMIGLSLVNKAQGGRYTKYMFNEGYEVTDDPVANEVYLVGRTSMGSADDTARIVGLDLFQRLTDSSGVGFREHSSWVDRRSLGATDERGLPTMFGTSCPMTVMFPARETALAFARISASYLLPALVGQQQTPPTITDAAKQSWIGEWREVARLTPSVQGNPLAVHPPQDFSENDFEGANHDTFTILWRELEQRRAQNDADIAAKVAMKRQQEEQAIFGPPPPAEANDGLTVLSRQTRHLQWLIAEYTTALDTFAKNPPPEELKRPVELEDDYQRRPRIPLPGGMRDGQLQKKAGALAAEYNAILDAHARNTRYALVTSSLRALVNQADARLRETMKWYSTVDLDQQARMLYSTGRSSHAWHGQLDLPHPHYRHLFDLISFRAADGDRNLAVERLYDAVTFPQDDATNAAAATGAPVTDFGARINHRYSQRSMAYLAQRATHGDVELDDASLHNADHLDAEGRERLADRVVEFFQSYYMESFARLNMFDLLEVGAEATGSNGRMQMGSLLLEHLRHIRGLMRGLVAFEETLWHDGPSQLLTSVFLAMNWDPNKSYQRVILDRAVKDLGSLTDRNQSPYVDNSTDPHRLDISYGQHGISLATIPDFYREGNSAMSEYLRHQHAWYGSREPIFPQPAPRSYGANKMPVHSSGEMERIVCAQHALEYDGTEYAPTYGTNLVGRVIRESSRPRQAPNWDTRTGGRYDATASVGASGAGAGYSGPYTGPGPSRTAAPNWNDGADAANQPAGAPSWDYDTSGTAQAPNPNGPYGGPVGQSGRANTYSQQTGQAGQPSNNRQFRNPTTGS